MKNCIIILLLLTLVIPGFAVYSSKPHDKGLLYLLMTNYGMFGYQNQGIWPKGTSESYIFGAGFWVGGLHKSATDTTRTSDAITPTDTVIDVYSTAVFDSAGVIRIDDELILYHAKTATAFHNVIRGFSQTTAAAHSSDTPVMKMNVKVSIGYDASSAASEFAPGDVPNEPGYPNPDERVLMTDDPNDTALWPLRDALGNPIIRSKQDSYAIFNDQDSARCAHPLLLKVIQVGYAWDYHYYEDFIFINYLLVNDGPDTIYQTHLAVNCDADIGDANDDLIDFDEARDLGYAYDSDFDEPGWIHTPGFMGFDFLESPQDTHGQQIGLTAFKITHNPGVGGQGEPDPGSDFEAFQLIAGYNYTTGIYHPFDTITAPTDVRFLQATGPFDFPPGETVKVVIAVVAGADTADFEANDNLAQNLYNSDYLTHDITVQTPNGGEEISGVYQITWDDSSSTGAPLLVDISCSRDNGATYQDIVTSIPDNYSYDWNTVGFPDGTRYLVRITVHDTIAVGEDMSDSLFTVNNPGNGVPDVVLLGPLSGTLRDTVTVTWWANDPDHDTLLIDLYAKRIGSDWQTIAQDLANTGDYEWYTFYFFNGTYRLMVVARDNDTSGFDTSLTTVTIINDHPPAAQIVHQRGGCNSLSLNCLLFDPDALTGHTYQILFSPIEQCVSPYNIYYCYDLWDATAGSYLIEHCSLGVYYDGRLCQFFSPIIDGFALDFGIQIDKASFRFIDFSIIENLSGYDGNLEIFGADSTGTAPPMNNFAWAFRGADYTVRWKKYPGDTTKLTLEVYDTTNVAIIPYAQQRKDSWQFGPSNASEIFDSTVHRGFYLDGGFFWFNKDWAMTVPPGPGDVWQIRSSGHRVPCNSNIYRFATTGIKETSQLMNKEHFSVLPSIFRNRSTISFSVLNESSVKVSVYNILGQRVTVLLDQVCRPGSYSMDWSAKDCAAGVYFIRIQANEIDKVKKVVYLR